MSKKFTRENRYLVMKRSDMLHLSKSDQERLSMIALRVDGARAAEGKRKLNCVIVESDWPEFKHVWQLLEARVCGSVDQQAIAATEVFLHEVKLELIRARAKFPGDRIMCLALAEEFGELIKAVLDESSANVRKEAVQTAVMAARVALDGDGSVREWRTESGLDPLLPVLKGGAV